jgi:dual specificity protein kinase YAK1
VTRQQTLTLVLPLSCRIQLNSKYDPHDEHNILRMRAHFIHRKHLCLVFECLSSNLYELIKQNGFRGLSIQLVKVFTTQLLDTMEVLHEARLIHCDLKPENILLKRCVALSPGTGSPSQC